MINRVYEEKRKTAKDYLRKRLFCEYWFRVVVIFIVDTNIAATSSYYGM